VADQAEIHRMAMSEDVNERREAARQLRQNFAHLPDKKQAWDDLHRLTSDTDSDVRRGAADALGSAFSHISDKKQAWDDLHRLTSDTDEFVRWGAADALGSAFSHIPDKKQAWDDLHRLTSDTDSDVRWGAADALGSAFSHISDKKQACDDLIRLTSDTDRNVRIAANHSSGKVCIFRAGEAENENGFRKEMENAIGFFEKASKEATYINPAEFCLPFYRSFFALTFKKQEAEAEVQKYIAEAKSAVAGSESKEKLLEAVENLGNALKEVQKARDFNEIKSDLNAYRRYCNRACELLDTAEEKVPGASRLIRKGLPIIDAKIKTIIAEIQEKARALCRQTKGTEYKEIGQQVNNVGLELTKIRDPIGLEKGVNNMLIPLSAMCEKMPKREKGEACELLEKIKQEQYVEDKLPLINMFLSKISTQMNKDLKKEKSMTAIKINKSKSVQIGVGKDIHQVQDSITPKRKASKKQTNPKETSKAIEYPKPPIPYLSELESEIADIFKSVYQKDRKPGISEVNAKTLESLKHKLHDLKASGNDIHWLDIGCGDGRCLEVLDDIQDRGNIYYHGIDISHRFLDDAEKRSRKYGIKYKIEAVNTADMKFDSEFDLVSAVLFLHEVDPLCLDQKIDELMQNDTGRHNQG
jgi:HEAT repeat protein